MYLVIAFIAYY